MDFDEKIAIEIIERLSLSDKTLRVWKLRGSIPDKYANAEYKLPVSLDKAGKIIQKRILAVLNSNLINSKVICSLTGVVYQRYTDVNRGKAAFTPDEILALKKEINRLKILIVKTFERRSESALKLLLESEIIYIRPVLRAASLSDAMYDKCARFKRSECSLNDSDYLQIKDAMIKFAMQLSL